MVNEIQHEIYCSLYSILSKCGHFSDSLVSCAKCFAAMSQRRVYAHTVCGTIASDDGVCKPSLLNMHLLT